MVKSVSCCCVYGSLLFSNLATYVTCTYVLTACVTNYKAISNIIDMCSDCPYMISCTYTKL